MANIADNLIQGSSWCEGNNHLHALAEYIAINIEVVNND
jgi:hypothetical protein